MIADLNLSKIMPRLVSAAIIAPIVLLAIWYGHWAFSVLAGVVIGVSVAELWKLTQSSPHRTLFFVLGLVLLLGGLSLCYNLRIVYGFELTIFFFLVVWASDTGAYFAGKIFGGPKMSPVISPNKTWSGYIGALLAPAFSLCILFWRLDPALFLGGIAIGMAGQAGDLLTSWLKRKVRVKDASDLIPGHGGLLDRLDSTLPAVCVYLALIKAGLLAW